MKTVALVPAYNEENHILPVLQKLETLVDYVIVIDDGSTDSTFRRMEQWARGNVKGVLYRRDQNGGKGQALRFGFQEIERMLKLGELEAGDVVINVDADGQHLLEDIPLLLERLVEKQYDVVLACRDLRLYPFIKRLGNRVLSSFASLLSGVRYRDCESGLRCMRVGVIPRVLKYYRGFRYSDSQEIAVITALQGLRIDNEYISRISYYKPEGPSLWDACYILYYGTAAALRTRLHRERSLADRSCIYRRIS